MIGTTINAQTKTFLSEENFAKLIKELSFPDEYAGQIFNFFTDVHTQDIEKFTAKYNISDEIMRKYYELFIKDIYINTQLEEMIYYG